MTATAASTAPIGTGSRSTGALGGSTSPHPARFSKSPNTSRHSWFRGHPITARRYDHLWTRIGHHLPGVATQQITTHWLRHTTLTWVERHHGYAVARAYAGHTGKNDAGTTATYITADLHKVAAALAALTGELHPLAEPRTIDLRPEGSV